MRILVTGGAGYIGTTLVPILLDGDHEVVVFDLLEGGPEPLLPLFRSRRFDCIRGDVRDGGALSRALAGCDAVVHLAAVSGYPACSRDPDTAEAVNVGGTENVAAAVGKERMVVFASTGSCYGRLEGRLCAEDSPLNPVSLYGETKTRGEEILRERCRPVIYRFATAYGLSPAMRYDLLLNYLCLQAVRDGHILLYEPEAHRTFVHVRDAAAAIVHALENYRAMADNAYNVGDESGNITKLEACERIRKQLPDLRIEIDPEGKDRDERDYRVDYARIRSVGFSVRHRIEDGVGEMVRAFRIVGPDPDA